MISAASAEAVTSDSTALLRVRGLKKTYINNRSGNQRSHSIAALQGVDLELARGTTLAVVGESGSGKSTLALCVAQIESADAGEVWFDGIDLAQLSYRELSSVRRKIQLIFQDSASALNSRLSVAELISEPLDIAAIGSRAERRRCVTECLEQVRLGPEHLTRSSLELSGGQRQRVAIARALTLAPKLLILDEAFSGLDLLVQEQILEVLRDLQRTQALTYLLITHDLGLASVFSERIAIMHQGRIVEQGKTSTILSHPKQSQTAALIAAVPKFTMRLAAEGGA